MKNLIEDNSCINNIYLKIGQLCAEKYRLESQVSNIQKEIDVLNEKVLKEINLINTNIFENTPKKEVQDESLDDELNRELVRSNTDTNKILLDSEFKDPYITLNETIKNQDVNGKNENAVIKISLDGAESSSYEINLKKDIFNDLIDDVDINPFEFFKVNDNFSLDNDSSEAKNILDNYQEQEIIEKGLNTSFSLKEDDYFNKQPQSIQDFKNQKGELGEALVAKELSRLKDAVVRNDFIVYKFHSSEITLQIDHLVISRNGIFILETKNWSGELSILPNTSNDEFNDGNQWLQKTKQNYSASDIHYSPLAQNNSKIKSLSEYFKCSEDIFCSIISIVGSNSLNYTAIPKVIGGKGYKRNHYVLNLDEIYDFITDIKIANLTLQNIKECTYILDSILKKNEGELKYKHIQNVKKIQNM